MTVVLLFDPQGVVWGTAENMRKKKSVKINLNMLIATIMIKEKHFRLFKYADGMALDGLLGKTNPSGDAAYLAHSKAFETYSVALALIICTKHVSHDDRDDEILGNFKYLGTTLDSQVSFSENTEYIFKRWSKRRQR